MEWKRSRRNGQMEWIIEREEKNKLEINFLTFFLRFFKFTRRPSIEISTVTFLFLAFCILNSYWLWWERERKNFIFRIKLCALCIAAVIAAWTELIKAKKKNKLTRIRRIACTISVRLVGRWTSWKPISYRRWEGVKEEIVSWRKMSWKVSWHLAIITFTLNEIPLRKASSG